MFIFDWANYKDDLLQIFNLRAGGLAIYGVSAAALSHHVRRNSCRASMADSGVLGLIAGQMIGRWGISSTAKPLAGIQRTTCLPCRSGKAW